MSFRDGARGFAGFAVDVARALPGPAGVDLGGLGLGAARDGLGGFAASSRRTDLITSPMPWATLTKAASSLDHRSGGTPSLGSSLNRAARVCLQPNDKERVACVPSASAETHVWTALRWQECFRSFAQLVGAAMCPTCLCGAYNRWP